MVLTCFLDGQIAQETLGYTLNSIKTFIENDHSKTIYIRFKTCNYLSFSLKCDSLSLARIPLNKLW